MTRREAATSPHRIQQAERRVKAVRLRKMGMSFSQIGAQLGITKQAAHKLVVAALQATQVEATDELRTLESERLDDMLRAIYAVASKGDVGAIDRILRIAERRAKLWGLDAPVKQELSGPEGAALAITLVIDK